MAAPGGFFILESPLGAPNLGAVKWTFPPNRPRRQRRLPLAKKATAAKAKGKPAGLPASLIAANRKHRTKQALAGTPDTHSKHDQTRVHAPRAPPDIRLLSKPEVLAIANVTYPTLWAWMRNGTFPRSRVCGGRSMWRSDEIDAWLAGLPIRPLKGDAAAANRAGVEA